MDHPDDRPIDDEENQDRETAGMGPGDGPGEDKRADTAEGALSPGSTADGAPTSMGGEIDGPPPTTP